MSCVPPDLSPFSAILLATSGAAFAQGKADRARIAVAEARAKVEAAAKLTGDGEMPRIQANAQAMLRTAEEDLAGMSKDKAIADANEASRLADTAIALSQRNRAADSQVQASVAVNAQADAAQANARADAAERAAADAQAAAAAAQADAAAARAAPPVAPVTTIITETVKTAAPVAKAPVRTATRKVVRRTSEEAGAQYHRHAPRAGGDRAHDDDRHHPRQLSAAAPFAGARGGRSNSSLA